ncbi:u6 snRNA-associated Sm [Babesia ovata]|uniref:U6 snRNA-associated Sm n=1 Tax=Babesia ovata TaxID=189622 RepID=A0A2H6KJ95_9APIC|nr:u6 snRNA-associated Sm [Babesia ovata]GBE63058.1 u6 snRNA-associated Sm [Babesia ovata]
MPVDDIAESLSSLSLQGNATVRSARGEIYTVDTATGDTFIKGTQRKDGSYRCDIKVRPGYVPQDEQGTYVPRFRRSPQTATAACIEADKENKPADSQAAEAKSASWRPVSKGTDGKEKNDIATARPGSLPKTNEAVTQRRTSNAASQSWRVEDSMPSRSANASGAVAADETAISKHRKKHEVAEAGSEQAGQPVKFGRTMTAPSKSFRDVKSVIKLNAYLNKKVYVKFSGGREVQGVLKGHDAMSNLVLDDTEEFLRDPEDPDRVTEKTRQLGLLVARGTSVTVIHPVEGAEKIANPFAGRMS